MSDPFVAEIRIFTGNFAPKGWAFCDGQILPISQNTALFSLLGTTYGGNGQSTFALPDMQGSAPMHPGQGPGLSLHDLGEQAGSDTTTLLITEIPAHSHIAVPRATLGTAQLPSGQTWAGNTDTLSYVPAATTPDTTMNPAALSISGSSFPHNNLAPYLVLNFIIALQGVFPPRT